MSRAKQRERRVSPMSTPRAHVDRWNRSICGQTERRALPTSMSRTSEMFTGGTTGASLQSGRRKYMANRDLRAMAWMATGLCFMIGAGCSRSEPGGSSSVEASSPAPSNNAPSGTKTDGQKAEPKSAETQSVEPQVQSEIEKMEAQKRASLLQDAQSAITETRVALAALDKGDKQTALSALEQATGKLDLVISRDPNWPLLPSTSIPPFSIFTRHRIQ